MLFSHILSCFNHENSIGLFVSLALGFVIGLERELTHKSAGLRTHILVCLGSTIFTILSIHGFPRGASVNGLIQTGDSARIAAQILAGIGFIGGGAVLRNGSSVRGLTTAASLWITASIGMAVGTGSYLFATLATFLAFAVLVLIRYVEKYFLSKYTQKGARIKVSIVCPLAFASEIKEWFYNEFKNSILEMNSSKSTKNDNHLKLTFIFDYFGSDPIGNAHKKLNELKYIESLTVQHITED